MKMIYAKFNIIRDLESGNIVGTHLEVHPNDLESETLGPQFPDGLPPAYAKIKILDNRIHFIWEQARASSKLDQKDVAPLRDFLREDNEQLGIPGLLEITLNNRREKETVGLVMG